MKWLVAILLFVGGGYAVWEVMYPTYTHRYRLTIDVDLDGKIHSGSSVVEVSARSQPKLLPDVGAIIKLRGEAVYVDLGQAGNLVAILALGPTGNDVDGMKYLALRAFAVESQQPLGQFMVISEMTGRRDLQGASIPALVTFDNPERPATAKLIPRERLSGSLMSGAKFRGAWIELTRDPVTKSIDQKLPWVGDYNSELAAEKAIRQSEQGIGPAMLPGTKFRRGM